MDRFYIIIEALQKTYGAGGVVMLPILLCGTIGFYFLYSTCIRIGTDVFRKDLSVVVKTLQKKLETETPERAITFLKTRNGILARELRLALNAAIKKPESFNEYMQVRMVKTDRYMRQGNRIIAVMTAAAPLLGLLGTVTGMVATFDVITLYGNQNPVLMADGISEALISTQSGLLIAFPLTLLKRRLDERIEYLIQQLELGATIIENHISHLESV